MSISLLCSSCNSKLSAPDAAAGQSLTCPKCKAAITVPTTKPAFEVVDEHESPKSAAAAAQLVKKKIVVVDDDDDAEETPKAKKESRQIEHVGRDKRVEGTSPEDVLRRSDYSAYRKVRIVSIIALVHGVGMILGCLFSFIPDPDTGRVPDDALNPAVAAAFGTLGLGGAVCGVTVLNGNRKWKSLVYVSGVLYFLALPVGPLLSIMMMANLSRYYKSVQQLEQA